MQGRGPAKGPEQLPRARIQLARHRRPGPRRGGPPHLRLPLVRPVRARADHRLLDHRRCCRRGAGLFRRLDRSLVPALHRDLDLDTFALSLAHRLLGAGARLLRAARHLVVVLLGVAGRPGARGIPARAQLRIYPGRARAGRVEPHHHVPPPVAQRHGRHHDVFAVHPLLLGDDADRARFFGLWPAAGLAFARRDALARQGQHSGAVARHLRLLDRRHHALALDLHWRSGARRVRSAQDLRVKAMEAPYDRLLEVKELSTAFRQGARETLAVDRISFAIKKGETVALVGESGSGKSVTALSVLKLLPYPAAHHPTGSIRFKNQELLDLPEAEIRRVRGDDITIIFQEPMTSLNPLHTIEKQIGEILLLHQGLSGLEARKRILELLTQVGIPDPAGRLQSYPHQLSGGQRQRVMIAMALANEPDLLIADEPTTALDVTVQAQILALLAEIRARLGMSLLFITHDLGIVRRIADVVCVMNNGKIVEQGPVEQVFTAPKHPYTKALLAAEPKPDPAPPRPDSPEVISASDLKVWLPVKRGLLRRTVGHIKAVDGVSLSGRKGETLGVVGESGSGKTTLGLAILRLISSNRPIVFLGKTIQGLTFKEMRPVRHDMQIVFQDPYGSLSPRMSVSDIIEEGLWVHHPEMAVAEREERVVRALVDVGLDPDTRSRYPHEFSGGQRQRIAVARAIVLEPTFVVLDEPTSALDMLIQSQIVDLLRDLQKRRNLTYLFISHDLKVVSALASRLIVMRNGKVVEEGAAAEIFRRPQSEYTRALFAAAFNLEAVPESMIDEHVPKPAAEELLDAARGDWETPE